MSQETEGDLLKESQAARSRIVDAVIRAAEREEVEFDFRYLHSAFSMFLVSANFRGLEFCSYDEQSSGIRLEASLIDKNEGVGIIRFGLGDSERFRSLVVSLAKKDPVLKSIRRKVRAEKARADEARRGMLKKELDSLNRIERSLKV